MTAKWESATVSSVAPTHISRKQADRINETVRQNAGPLLSRGNTEQVLQERWPVRF